MKTIPDNLQKLSIKTYPLLPDNILRVEKVRSLLDPELQKEFVGSEIIGAEETAELLAGMDKLVEGLTTNKTHQLTITMGVDLSRASGKLLYQCEAWGRNSEKI